MLPEPKDLYIPIYLNQKTIVDLLATIEDGFSDTRDVTQSNTDSTTSRNEYGGSFGLGGISQFLGLSFGGDARRGTGQEDQNVNQVAQTKMYTPSSLFHKLRSLLEAREDSPIKTVESTEGIQQLSAGDFIEFRAILRKNPLVELFETLGELVNFALQTEAAENEQPQPSSPEQQSPEQQLQDFQKLLSGDFEGIGDMEAGDALQGQSGVEAHPMYKMIKVFQDALAKEGALEIIGEMLDAPGVNTVLSTRLEGFDNGDMSEIIDGEFRVLGKVVRVVSSGDEGIKLLRKPPLGALKDEYLENLTEMLTTGYEEDGELSEEEQEIPIEIPDIKTTVEGPALLILPVAIFV